MIVDAWKGMEIYSSRSVEMDKTSLTDFGKPRQRNG